MLLLLHIGCFSPFHTSCFIDWLSGLIRHIFSYQNSVYPICLNQSLFRSHFAAMNTWTALRHLNRKCYILPSIDDTWAWAYMNLAYMCLCLSLHFTHSLRDWLYFSSFCAWESTVSRWYGVSIDLPLLLVLDWRMKNADVEYETVIKLPLTHVRTICRDSCWVSTSFLHTDVVSWKLGNTNGSGKKVIISVMAAKMVAWYREVCIIALVVIHTLHFVEIYAQVPSV